MKKILVLFFGILSTFTIAQNDKAYVESLVSEFTISLKNKAVNDYFYMYEYCDGHIEIFQVAEGRTCTSKGTYYEVFVFWKEGDQAMLTKIDNCGKFNSLAISNSDLYDFAINNSKQLKNGEVKKYEVQNPENVPKQRSEIHSCNRKFQFNIAGDSFGQTYNLYHLTNESKYENLNYKSNNSLKIVELEKKIAELVSKMEAKFRRK